MCARVCVWGCITTLFSSAWGRGLGDISSRGSIRCQQHQQEAPVEPPPPPPSHQRMRMAPFTCTLLTLFFISFALQEGKRLVMVLGSKPFVRGPEGRVCSGPAEPPPCPKRRVLSALQVSGSPCRTRRRRRPRRSALATSEPNAAPAATGMTRSASTSATWTSSGSTRRGESKEQNPDPVSSAQELDPKASPVLRSKILPVGLGGPPSRRRRSAERCRCLDPADASCSGFCSPR